jgi:serine/threonine-protein kinase
VDPSDEQDALIGQVVAGRYEVMSLLGQGGMGAVYAACQAPLGRKVAIKVLLRELTTDPVASQRFEKEAKAISLLAHPNIVTIFDYGATGDGQSYIAMEFLDGVLLRDAIANDAPLSPRRVTRIMMHTARALAAAHREGIVHRDLKPDNVMLLSTAGEPDFVKVLDFGVAKLRRGENEPAVNLTATNIILGTPKYMSPEQINGISDDPRSDLYALGAMAFEMLTGQVPFDGETAVKVLMRHLQDPRPSVHDVVPDSPASDLLDQLVQRLMAVEADDRPPSAERFLELLEDLPEYTGPRSRSGGTQPQATRPAPARGESGRGAPAVTNRSRHRPGSAPPGPVTPRPGGGAVPLGSALVPAVSQPSSWPGWSAWVGGAAALVGVLAAVWAAVTVVGGGAGPARGPGFPDPGAQVALRAGPSSSVAAAAPAPTGDGVRPVEFPDSSSGPGEAPAPAASRGEVEPAAKLPPHKRVVVTVTSDPEGAEVWEGEALRGVTPAEVVLPRGTGTRRLTLKLNGFRDVTRAVVPDRDRAINVDLDGPGAGEARRRGDGERKAGERAAKASARKKGEEAPAFEKFDDLKDPGF